MSTNIHFNLPKKYLYSNIKSYVYKYTFQSSKQIPVFKCICIDIFCLFQSIHPHTIPTLSSWTYPMDIIHPCRILFKMNIIKMDIIHPFSYKGWNIVSASAPPNQRSLFCPSQGRRLWIITIMITHITDNDDDYMIIGER